MERNYLIVEEVEEKDLVKVLADFAAMYKRRLAFEIELYRKYDGELSFVVTLDIADFYMLAYLVHYIRYPEGFFGPFAPKKLGYYKGTPDSPVADYMGRGNWLMVYVSRSDTEFSNVTFVNARNQSYFYEFSSEIAPLDATEEPYRLIVPNMMDYNRVRTFTGMNGVENKKSWWKLWRVVNF